MKTESMEYTSFESPFGALVISGAGGRIQSVRVVDKSHPFVPGPSWRRADDVFAQARSQLAAYFEGRLRKFSLPLDLRGTPFQVEVWRVLGEVPYAATTTYGDLARKVGRPEASRAVGGAMNRNPISIVLPCHRVVGKNGSLTGYLNGTDMKRRLLEMEADNCRRFGRDSAVA